MNLLLLTLSQVVVWLTCTSLVKCSFLSRSNLLRLSTLLHHAINYVPDAPRITLTPKNKKVLDEETVSFFCKASGNPAPEIHWRKGGRRIRDGRQRYFINEMPHGSVLRIDPVNYRRDGSDFSCVAENGIGQPVEAVAHLTVYQAGERELWFVSILS